jgi:hypothetical protein
MHDARNAVNHAERNELINSSSSPRTRASSRSLAPGTLF